MTSEQSQVSKPAGVRVRLCLEENMVACGPYLEARMVDQLEVSGSWLVALIVIVTLLTLLALLIAIKCICQTRRKSAAKTNNLNHRHATNMDSYKAQMFAIAADNQHGAHHGAGFDHHDHHQTHVVDKESGANSHTDSANSQEPLWAYQKSPSDYYPSAALEGYENNISSSYPYIDETPSDPDRNYLTHRELQPVEGRISRPISGQCK